MLEIKFKKLHPDAKIPTQGTSGSAGWDLTATSIEIIQNEQYTRIVYGTGLAIQLQENHVGFLFPRSSINKTDLRLANSVGVLDSDYTGEIKLIFDCPKYFYTETKNLNIYKIGDRISQLVIIPYPKVSFVEVDNLDETERGDKGFGSTDLINEQDNTTLTDFWDYYWGP